MAPFLTRVIQDDFSGGFFRSVSPELIPENGAYDIVNYLLNEGGQPYRRGGASYKNGATFDTDMTFLWDGYLDVGQRTLFASTGKFGVLDSNDSTNITLTSSVGMPYPKAARVVASGSDPAKSSAFLFIGGGYIYGGSRKTATYNTGTVTVTVDSQTVTGSGTSFTANVDPGMLFQQASTERVYTVKTVDSTTQITLTEPYSGPTEAGASYNLRTLYSIAAGDPYPDSDFYCVAANRLLSATGRIVKFSAISDPHSFDAGDYHELPEGVTISGMEAVGQDVLIFTTRGIWILRGIAFDIVDADGNPQHQLVPLSRDLVQWGGPAGIASWENLLVVPTTNGVYLLDGTTSPVRLSRSIEPLYQFYVAGNYRVGTGTVYRNHYFLPIATSSNVVELLVCRLDRPTDDGAGHRTYPWVRITGYASHLISLATRIGDPVQQPKLLGAQMNGSRILDCTPFFEPDSTHKSDPDGSAHRAFVISRDIPTGNLTTNYVRKLRPRALILDAGSDNPSMVFAWTDGTPTPGPEWGTAVWNAFSWTSGGSRFKRLGTMPESDGINPYTLRFNKKARFVRLYAASKGPCAENILRSLELFIRPSEATRK